MPIAQITSADLNAAATMASAEIKRLAVTLMNVQTAKIIAISMLLVSTPNQLSLILAMMDTQETKSSVLISTNVQMVPITAQLMVVAPTPTEALHS